MLVDSSSVWTISVSCWIGSWIDKSCFKEEDSSSNSLKKSSLGECSIESRYCCSSWTDAWIDKSDFCDEDNSLKMSLLEIVFADKSTCWESSCSREEEMESNSLRKSSLVVNEGSVGSEILVLLSLIIKYSSYSLLDLSSSYSS